MLPRITDVGSQRIKTAGTRAIAGGSIAGVLVCLLVLVVCVIAIYIVAICIPSIFIAERIVFAVVLLLVVLLVSGVSVCAADCACVQADQGCDDKGKKDPFHG